MSHKGCLSVTKYFLFLFNVFFFILGSLVFSFGLWILFDQNNFASTLGSSYYALKIWSYVFSGVGILTMFLGFLGCLGSLKEVKCMLGLYFAFLLLLFVSQVIIAILIQTHSNTITSTVAGRVKTIIAGYGTNTSLSDGDSWDFVQEQFQCCGWKGWADWMENSRVRNASNKEYPCSCQNTSALHSANNGTTDKPALFCRAEAPLQINNRGCRESVQTWLNNNIISIVGICLGIALLELFLMMVSMFLCRTIGPNYDKLARYS
ncbi:PREDICTED: leukocyte antigen CD37 [Thamnophis sirtalis]|uniref:Tetraspanin n=1 Tax=Thamnophis sirtalis TaxID=35019 RepID=A0A6I9XW46_9SAUR|nr:PREDICTED: leukocyte antigen CD37 [Thamnophis sirtalis]XP_013908781.1 PREDICTED: leukocyte antigen CD37 [Thamnophis sirtalis]XP_032092544.1 leukocyte antigen CD37 [Thamnophis elegans]